MSEHWNVDRTRTKDGRYAEERRKKVVSSDPCADQYETEEVVETWEENRPLELKQRVREIKRPMVVERVIEDIEGDEVVERRIESVDGAASMRLVDHVGLARPRAAAEDFYADSDCMSREEADERFATLLREHREESHSQMRDLVDGLKDALKKEDEDDEWDGYEYHQPQPQAQSVSTPAPQQMSMQSVAENNVDEQDQWGAIEWILLGVIGVEAAYLLMNVVMPMLKG